MAGKFMKIKRIIIPTMTLIILMSQACGCAVVDSKEMVKMIDEGQVIAIEVSKPNYDLSVLGVEEVSSWEQLDRLETYSRLRMDMDTLFHINKITSQGVDSKNGCMYVVENNVQNGNTTLYDAFRNKAFINKYWNNKDIKKEMMQISTLAYTDTDPLREASAYATLNAYFDMINDNIEPNSFNANQSMTREQFYAFMFKSCNYVQELSVDSKYEEATGGKTDYSIYAQQVDQYAFLNTDNKCLDKANVKGSISRAEAVYMIVNKFFSEELKNIKGNESAYSDCKNSGDLALKAKFKEKKNNVITEKENWQAYTLAYMMRHPNDGMQEELYKAMVVARQQGLLGEIGESRWDETISKAESIQLIVNAFEALNKRDGFLTTAEYGTIVENQITRLTLSKADKKKLAEITDENGGVSNAGQGSAPAIVEEPGIVTHGSSYEIEQEQRNQNQNQNSETSIGNDTPDSGAYDSGSDSGAYDSGANDSGLSDEIKRKIEENRRIMDSKRRKSDISLSEEEIAEISKEWYPDGCHM